jgi:hypothetical protein
VAPTPSIVVIECPVVALTGITQDRLGMPSRCTVHAPQRATPQPNFVPFMPRRSRRTHSNGMSGDASTVWDSPLIFNVTMIDLPTHPEEWLISTRPMSDKVYQRAALCVTAKFVCQ